MLQLDISFPQHQLDDFKATMEAFQRVTGKSQKEVVKWGTINVCKSLRKSTRKSKTVRSVYLPKKKKEKDFVDAFGRRLLYVQSFNTLGKEVLTPVWAKSKDQVKHFGIAKITGSGLAKASWGHAMQFLFGIKAGGISMSGRHRRGMQERMIMRKFERGNEVGVVIDNNLSYIRKAFRTKGKSAVSGALARAVSGMKHNVAEAMRKRGF